MCSVSGRYSRRSQYCYRFYPERSCSLRVHSQDEKKLTVENNHFGVIQVEIVGRTISSERVSPQVQQTQKYLSKLRFRKPKKALQPYLGFVNYYKKNDHQVGRKVQPRLQTFEDKSHSQYIVRTEGIFWLSQQSAQPRLWTRNETASAWKSTCLDRRCKLQECWICSNDTAKSRTNYPFKKENFRASGVRIKNLLVRETENVNVFKWTIGNIHDAPQVWTHFVGGSKADNRITR